MQLFMTDQDVDEFNFNRITSSDAPIQWRQNARVTLVAEIRTTGPSKVRALWDGEAQVDEDELPSKATWRLWPSRHMMNLRPDVQHSVAVEVDGKGWATVEFTLYR
jgi:hypothetical protein